MILTGCPIKLMRYFHSEYIYRIYTRVIIKRVTGGCAFTYSQRDVFFSCKYYLHFQIKCVVIKSYFFYQLISHIV